MFELKTKKGNSPPVIAGLKQLICGVFMLLSVSTYADERWMSATLDNDFFVNEDNGYTNGIFVSFYDVYDDPKAISEPDFWVTPLLWSMPSQNDVFGAINVYSFGQTLTTPYDISEVTPSDDTLPYSGLIHFSNTYVTAGPRYAERITTILGVVGPAALGEQTQKIVHKVTSSQEPMGWDTQLNNELVFQFSRGRTVRYWVSDSDKMDVLSISNISIGTIKSDIKTGVMFRYGEQLGSSYASVLLSNARTSNPIAVKKGWFVYVGVGLGYTFNQIFADGNTFRDSRSIDYNHNQNLATYGFSYTWGDASLAFAINSPFSFGTSERDHDVDELTEYGTLTFAWNM